MRSKAVVAGLSPVRRLAIALCLAALLIALAPCTVLAATTGTDLAPFQWSIANAGRTFVTQGMSTGTNLEQLGWNDAEQPLSSAGTIAILSTGVDEGHPELQDALLDMTPFTDEGGLHGVDAVALAAGEDASDLTDREGTGTHCAGIIAAAWDDVGTSGISNNTKIIPIKVTDDEGVVSTDAVIAAYGYLERAMDNGLVVTAVCNPWPVPRSDEQLLTAVNELGERGAVSIFASGDEGLDLDQERLSTGKDESSGESGQDSQSPLDVSMRDSWVSDSPYAIVVNSSGVDDSRSWFSNAGVQTTDLFAPGEETVSTVPTGLGGYLPETVENSLLAESFASDDSEKVAALAIGDETALDACDWEQGLGEATGTIESDVRYDGLDEGGGALEIPEKDLLALGGDGADAGSRRGVVLAVSLPEDVGLADSSADLAGLSVGFHAFADRLAKDEPVRVAVSIPVRTGDDGVAWSPRGDACPAALRGDIGTTWHGLSFSIADAVEAAGANEPVVVDGDGDDTPDTLYLLLELENSTGSLYIDTFGLGEQGSSYAYRSGTAQAAAYAAGATSVFWPRIGGSIAGSERATALIGAMQQTSAPSEEGALSSLCYFGGKLDLERVGEMVFPQNSGEAGSAGTIAATTDETTASSLSAFGFFRMLIGLLVITVLVVSAAFATQKVRTRRIDR